MSLRLDHLAGETARRPEASQPRAIDLPDGYEFELRIARGGQAARQCHGGYGSGIWIGTRDPVGTLLPRAATSEPWKSPQLLADDLTAFLSGRC